MRKKTDTRKKFGRICALVVVGMFVMMTSMSTSANDPDDWSMGGDSFGGGTTQILGTLSPDSVSIIAGGQQGIIVSGGPNPGFVGIGLAYPMNPVNRLDVAGGMAVGGDFAGLSPAPSNGMIIEGWVGIGTTEPHYPLEVVGDVWLNSDTIKMGDGTFYNKVQKDAKLSTGNFRIIIDENDDQTDRYFSVEKDEGKNDPQGSGTELMRCQENGNVGIATKAPTEKLDVNGRVRVRDLPIDNNLVYVVAADSTGVLHRRDASTIGIDADWYDVGNPGNPPDNINDNIYTYGNVGIGTASPIHSLHVAGDVYITGGLFDKNNLAGSAGQVLKSTGSQIEWADLTSVSDGDWDYTTNSPHMFSLPTGNVGIGTATPSEKLDVNGRVRVRDLPIDNTLTYVVAANSTGVLHRRNASTIGVDGDWDYTTNSPHMFSLPTGNVGIGTAIPSEKLDVNGRVRVRDLPIDNTLTYVVAANSTGVLHRRNASTLGADDDWYDVDNPGNPPDNINDNIYTYGNVGIGTENPIYPLDIEGDINMSSGYILWPETQEAGHHPKNKLHTIAGHRENHSAGTILETERILFESTGTAGEVKVTPKGIDIEATFSSSLRGIPSTMIINDGNSYTYTLQEKEIGWFCWRTYSGVVAHGMYFMHSEWEYIMINCLGEYDQSG